MPRPSRADASPDRRLGLVLAIACVAQFMVVMDAAIVNVALPQLRAELRLAPDALQWVVDAYLVAFGGLLLLAARAGDLYGRRRVFLAGLALFTAASLVGGLANGPAMLLAARAGQGAGAAALAPGSLSLITSTHHDQLRRARAISFWSAAGTAGTAAGVVIGGVLTQQWGWRWVLFVNVPIGCVLTAAALIRLPPDVRGEHTGLDLPGALTITLGAGALVYGLSQASIHGWASAAVFGVLGAAVLLLAGFVVIERSVRNPLLRLGLLQVRQLRLANLAMLCLGGGITSTTFILSLYLQQVLGYPPLRAGLALFPMAVALCVGTAASHQLHVRGLTQIPLLGGVVGAAGLLWLAAAPGHPAYLLRVLGPTVLIGLGFSVMIVPLVRAATDGIPARDAGIGSGLLNVTRQIGGALGLSGLLAIASAVTGSAAGPAAELRGYHLALLCGAGVVLAGVALSSRLRADPEG